MAGQDERRRLPGAVTQTEKALHTARPGRCACGLGHAHAHPRSRNSTCACADSNSHIDSRATLRNSAGEGCALAPRLPPPHLLKQPRQDGPGVQLEREAVQLRQVGQVLAYQVL